MAKKKAQGRKSPSPYSYEYVDETSMSSSADQEAAEPPISGAGPAQLDVVALDEAGAALTHEVVYARVAAKEPDLQRDLTPKEWREAQQSVRGKRKI